MNDAPLISLLTQAQLQGIRSGTSSSSATAVPPAVAHLPTGTILSGRIMGKDGQGNPILRTEQGDLPLHTNFKLRSGSEVVIRLESSSAGLRARILSIDGMTPKLAAKYQPSAGDTVKTSLEVTSTPPQKMESTVTAQRPAHDSLHLSIPKEAVFKAILLSRSQEFPDIIRQLPQSVQVSEQRLSTGAQLSFRVISSSIPVESGTTVQQPQGVKAPPATITTTQTTPTVPASQQPSTQPSNPQGTATAASSTTAQATAPTTPQQTLINVQEVGVKTTETVNQQQIQTATAARNTAPVSTNATTNTTPANTPANTAAGTTPTPSTTAAAGSGATNPTATTGEAKNTTVQSKPETPASPTLTNTITRSYVPANPYAAYKKGSAQTPPPAPITTNTATLQTAAAATNTSNQVTISSGQVAAQVVGTEKSGDIVLNSSMGTLKLPAATLPTEVKLPTGTQLVIELVSLKPSNAADSRPAATQPLPTQTAEASTLPTLSKIWPALEELITTLHQFSPTASSQFIHSAIPKIGEHLTTSMVFFIAALRGGNIQQWLGRQNVELLEQQQRSDILRSLGADFQLLRNAFVESPSPNWQTIFFPVLHEKELHQARLFIKKDGKNPNAPPDHKKGMRFIVEVELSELGDMQLDGFIKKKDKDTRFDLMVRTLKPMQAEHSKEITHIFNDAAEITGFRGQLQFSYDDHFPIVPLDEVLDHNNNIVA